MNRTKIEWCQNPDGTPGYTWNPITGCLKGCSYCYARKLAETRLRVRHILNDVTAPGYHDQPFKADPFYPRYWPERITDCYRLTHKMAARGIFVCSMGDLFGNIVPEEWTKDVLWAIRNRPQHRFYLLTKQPQNLAKWSPFPDNCWVGVSTTDGESFYDATEGLSKVEASVKYISFEPLLGEINGGECEGKRLDLLADAGINWIIIGAQTKPYIPPEPDWVNDITRAADAAGIPVFLKDSLAGVELLDGKRLRQEMPVINKS